MNRDLFLAILSMDSYNRGYGQGVKAEFLPGSSIGNAIVGITVTGITDYGDSAQNSPRITGLR